MRPDPTEHLRRLEIAKINAAPQPKEVYMRAYGADNVWTTDELKRDFEVLSFLAPFAKVQRQVDGVVGAVRFQHSPRIYFDFQPV